MNNKMIAEEKIKNAEGVLNTKAFALFPSLLTSISTGEESKTNEITIESRQEPSERQLLICRLVPSFQQTDFAIPY